MGSIDKIVKVTIRRGTKQVTKKGFGTILILGSTATWPSEYVREYADYEGVLADFASSTPEAKAAALVFGGEVKPKNLLIGKSTAAVAQVNTLTPVAANAFNYQVTINGITYSYLSDSDATVSEIVAGLVSAINAGTEPVTASGTSTLVLTADEAGVPFTVTMSTNLTGVATTANSGPIESLANIMNVRDDFYHLIMTDKDEDMIKQVAAFIETQKKILWVSSNLSAIGTSATTDLFSFLKNKSYFRTVLLYSGDSATNYPEASWAADAATRTPGSYTAKFKSLPGVTVDTLTPTVETFIKSKNGNTYTVVGGQPITAEGKVAGGEFIDVMIFIDWLQSQIEEEVYSALVSAAKIPYTDKGVAVIENILRAQLIRGVNVGGLTDNPLPSVSVPVVADIPTSVRATRTLPDVKFNATLAGAIHFVEIEGVVSV